LQARQALPHLEGRDRAAKPGLRRLFNDMSDSGLRSRVSWVERIALGVEGIGAVVVVGLTVLDWVGALSQPWFRSNADRFILLAVGVVLATSFAERVSFLRSIRDGVAKLVDASALGHRYLDTDQAPGELERLVDTARETILAAGSRSMAASYLRRLAGRVKKEGVQYSRLLAGRRITHELHEHLVSLVGHESVHVAWNPNEKYGSFTVSEAEVFLALPVPLPEQFAGLKLTGPEHSVRYSAVFALGFNEGLQIRNARSLQILCDRCSPGIARGEVELREALLRAEAPAVVP
jgi:hypothetical protein